MFSRNHVKACRCDIMDSTGVSVWDLPTSNKEDVCEDTSDLRLMNCLSFFLGQVTWVSLVAVQAYKKLVCLSEPKRQSVRQYSRWKHVIPKCNSIRMYLVLFSRPLFMPPNIFFSWVNVICEAQFNVFQVIASPGNAMSIQRSSDSCVSKMLCSFTSTGFL